MISSIGETVILREASGPAIKAACATAEIACQKLAANSERPTTKHGEKKQQNIIIKNKILHCRL